MNSPTRSRKPLEFEFDPAAIIAYLKWKLETDDCASLWVGQALDHYWLKREVGNLGLEP